MHHMMPIFFVLTQHQFLFLDYLICSFLPIMYCMINLKCLEADFNLKFKTYEAKCRDSKFEDLLILYVYAWAHPTGCHRLVFLAMMYSFGVPSFWSLCSQMLSICVFFSVSTRPVSLRLPICNFSFWFQRDLLFFIAIGLDAHVASTFTIATPASNRKSFACAVYWE
jgi:hypothetical protein